MTWGRRYIPWDERIEEEAILKGEQWRRHPGEKSNMAERSIAISLKRIADLLERKEQRENVHVHPSDE